MARYDIMPYKSFNGGVTETRSGIIDTAAAFLVGEPVCITANGTILGSIDPVNGLTVGVGIGTGDVIGIAAVDAVKQAALFASDGTVATANNEGVHVPYWPVGLDQEFVTRNFASAGDAVTTGVALVTHVGDLVALCADATPVWGISNNLNFLNFQITRLIRALDFRDLTDTDPAPTVARLNLLVFRRNALIDNA